MCKRSNLQSALCIAQGDNDVVVLVVGGCGGKSNEAQLLYNRPKKNEIVSPKLLIRIT